MAFKTIGTGKNQHGVSRREFLKFCTAVAGVLGLGSAFGPKIAEALTSPDRPPTVWLHFAECTGCTESVLRTTSPWFDELILNTISVDYHETIMAAAGLQAEEALYNTVAQYSGQYFCVVEGAIPTASNGVYGMIGDKTMLSIAQEVCPQALAVIAIGTCASYGGLPAADPNPTGARGVGDALGSSLTLPLINVPGCPPNPINLVATIAEYLLQGSLPAVDSLGRPTFAYGRRVHDRCPYDEGDESRCLEDIGCKGKQCYNNCPSVQFNDGTSWPVRAGHPCIGCSQPQFWDTMTPFYRESEEHESEGSEAEYGSREYGYGT